MPPRGGERRLGRLESRAIAEALKTVGPRGKLRFYAEIAGIRAVSELKESRRGIPRGVEL